MPSETPVAANSSQPAESANKPAEASPDKVAVSEAAKALVDAIKNPAPHTEPSSMAFQFLIDDWLAAAKLSGILLAAVLITWASSWLLGPAYGFGVAVLVIIGLNQTWLRQMRLYQLRIAAEVNRRRGVETASFLSQDGADCQMDSGDESAEWFNQMLARFWLIFEPVISDGILASVNPLLEYYTPGFLVCFNLILN